MQMFDMSAWIAQLINEQAPVQLQLCCQRLGIEVDCLMSPERSIRRLNRIVDWHSNPLGISAKVIAERHVAEPRPT
ncbi:hypothetical protein GCM10011499_33750 [Pelagibacterium lentulum]|uniref:Uncharacterized protein n=1 Tax=Pelagibacterium lentulum TaxID=2029865 RepID=A0A916RL40_9HYPH|nr:hypothetical protein [Pelagibacterium lentulum]GGA60762.1 hypothetical protein GCM10011499_33750 [Pelagibacterium lentulum]